MNFTISGEPYLFTLVVDNGVLTAFSASDNGTIYQCSIELMSQGFDSTLVCCTPSGCTAGACSGAQP